MEMMREIGLLSCMNSCISWDQMQQRLRHQRFLLGWVSPRICRVAQPDHLVVAGG